MRAGGSQPKPAVFVLILNVCFYSSFQSIDLQVRADFSFPVAERWRAIPLAKLRPFGRLVPAVALLLFMLFVAVCPSRYRVIQVCRLCEGTVLHGSEVRVFCSSAAGRIDGRCCVRNDNSSDPERAIVGYESPSWRVRNTNVNIYGTMCENFCAMKRLSIDCCCFLCFFSLVLNVFFLHLEHQMPFFSPA